MESQPKSQPPSAEKTSFATYHTAYHGVARDQSGAFRNFIRRLDESHIQNGYWRFASAEDEQHAYAYGIHTPEDILCAVDGKHGEYTDVKMHWVPGKLDAIMDMHVSGCAEQHLQEIANIRRFLGFSLSWQGDIPHYPVDARLKDYWSVRRDVLISLTQENSVSTFSALNTTLPPILQRSSALEQTPPNIPFSGTSQVRGPDVASQASQILPINPSPQTPSSASRLPILVLPNLTTRSHRDDDHVNSRREGNKGSYKKSIPQHHTDRITIPKGMRSNTQAISDLKSPNKRSTNTSKGSPNLTYPQDLHKHVGKQSVSSLPRSNHGLGNSILTRKIQSPAEPRYPPSFHKNDSNKPSSPANKDMAAHSYSSPYATNNSLSSSPTELAKIFGNNRLLAKEGFRPAQKGDDVDVTHILPKKSAIWLDDVEGVNETDEEPVNVVPLTCGEALPRNLSPAQTHVTQFQKAFSQASGPDSYFTNSLTDDLAGQQEPPASSDHPENTQQMADRGIESSDDAQESARTTDMCLEFPCMDCGQEIGHKWDCHIAKFFANLKATENLTVLDYRELRERVDRFDPGPWTDHYGPPPEPAPEDPQTQIQGMAEVIRNEESYKKDASLHALPDELMIMLWALKMTSDVEIIED